MLGGLNSFAFAPARSLLFAADKIDRNCPLGYLTSQCSNPLMFGMYRIRIKSLAVSKLRDQACIKGPVKMQYIRADLKAFYFGNDSR